MPNPELLRGLCYEDGALKTKAESRAAMINYLILEDEAVIDIDEAENLVDRLLRDWNLWNEPTLEEILYGDDDATIAKTA